MSTPATLLLDTIRSGKPQTIGRTRRELADEHSVFFGESVESGALSIGPTALRSYESMANRSRSHSLTRHACYVNGYSYASEVVGSVYSAEATASDTTSTRATHSRSVSPPIVGDSMLRGMLGHESRVPIPVSSVVPQPLLSPQPSEESPALSPEVVPAQVQMPSLPIAEHRVQQSLARQRLEGNMISLPSVPLVPIRPITRKR